MKTGQMLFVALGGIMLGAAGTLAVQTGLVHYEITLDVRPRGPFPGAPLVDSPLASDSYVTAPPASVQGWHTTGDLPLVNAPPLDDEQVAEIVSLREQINHPASQKLCELAGSTEDQCSADFASCLRLAAEAQCETCPPTDSEVAAGPLARGLLSGAAVLR